MVWRAALLVYTTVTVDCCKRYIGLDLEMPRNNKGETNKYLAFNANGPTFFPERNTKRTEEPNPIDGPRPNDPNWSKGWGLPDGMSTPWGKGGLNPTTDESGAFSDYQTENPNPWDDDPHVPDSWKGLGPGFSGAPLPPHAYVPTNYGKPSYCFQPPVKGKCEKELKRFAYNPFLDQCHEFTYSGCSGSENNFLTKEVCETKCTNLPGADCDPLADDTIDLGNYMDVSRRCA